MLLAIRDLFSEHLIMRRSTLVPTFVIVIYIVGKDLHLSCGDFCPSLIIFKVATIHLTRMDMTKDAGTGVEGRWDV